MSDIHSTSPQPTGASPAAKGSGSGEIRLDLLFRTIVTQWRRYILPLGVTFVVSCIIMLCIPRYYTVKVKLVPEYASSSMGSLGSLASLASMASVDLSSTGGGDAIGPQNYPDVLSSTAFAVPLFDVHVQTKDGKFEGRYVDYLTEGRKSTPWDLAFAWVKNLISPPKTEAADANPVVNPYQLTRRQNELYEAVCNSIDCVVDKKTGVITITTTAQDPLVAAQLADTVRVRLQEFIIQYRTHKAANDCEHYEKMLAEKEAEYREAGRAYSAFADANQNVVLPSYRQKEEDLENELQAAYTAFSTAKLQLATARAKLTERTPAFTTLQNVTVPVRHAGPKRMVSVAALTLLAFILTTFYLLWKSLRQPQPAAGRKAEEEEPDAEPEEV